MSIDNKELATRFAYHAPRDEATVKAHEAIRAAARDFATLAADPLPADRPRENALVSTKIEEAMMWANASIARSEAGVTGG